MEGERVVFTEETDPANYVKLVASGAVDDSLLEALEDYVKRQRKRLSVLSRFDDPAKRAAAEAEIIRHVSQVSEDSEVPPMATWKRSAAFGSQRANERGRQLRRPLWTKM